MKYLQHGDRVFSTGCFLRYDEQANSFRFDGLEDDTYFDGDLVDFDDNDKPYIIPASQNNTGATRNDAA